MFKLDPVDMVAAWRRWLSAQPTLAPALVEVSATTRNTVISLRGGEVTITVPHIWYRSPGIVDIEVTGTTPAEDLPDAPTPQDFIEWIRRLPKVTEWLDEGYDEVPTTRHSWIARFGDVPQCRCGRPQARSKRSDGGWSCASQKCEGRTEVINTPYEEITEQYPPACMACGGPTRHRYSKKVSKDIWACSAPGCRSPIIDGKVGMSLLTPLSRWQPGGNNPLVSAPPGMSDSGLPFGPPAAPQADPIEPPALPLAPTAEPTETDEDAAPVESESAGIESFRARYRRPS